MFSLTPAAARQIQQAAESSDAQAMALRIAARLDGDGTVHYGMGFDDPQDDDLKLDLDGVAVVIADAHQDLLDATVLDFVELQPGEFNFIFIDARQAREAPEVAPAGGCGAGGCGPGGCGGQGPRP